MENGKTDQRDLRMGHNHSGDFVLAVPTEAIANVWVFEGKLAADVGRGGIGLAGYRAARVRQCDFTLNSAGS